MRWWPKDVEAFERATAHLELKEVGIYNRLLDWYYDHEKPLPDNEQQLRAVCRAVRPSDSVLIMSVVREFFSLGADGAWHQKRADEEIEKATKIRIDREGAAKRGAAATKAAWSGKPKAARPGNRPGKQGAVSQAQSTSALSKPTEVLAATSEPVDKSPAPENPPNPPPPDPTPPGNLNPRIDKALRGIKASLEGKERPTDANAGAEQVLAETKTIPGAFIQNQKGTHWGSREDLLLANLIFQHLKSLAPKARVKQPKWFTWADALRRLRLERGVDDAQLLSLFESAVARPEWARRILSPNLLGRHFEALQKLETANPPGTRWFDSKEGILAKAKAEGVPLKQGESMAALIAKINSKIEAKTTHH